MADVTDAELDAAAERGRVLRQVEPRARAAHFDAVTGRVVVALTNGCTFAFPPDLVEGLGGASNVQLERIELLGAGYGLHWDALDVDISVPGLLAGLFGTKAYLASQAGRSSSTAKSAAARANGARGGRPRKSA